MKNNNKKVITQIAKKEYYADRKRHMILTGAVAFAVMTLFCVFSFAAGKIDTDILREARTRGVVTNTTLERATEEQYEQIRKLPYIKDVGRCVRFGSTLEARCAVVDDVAWEKIKKPAFTDIHGKYPQEKMEVMLPMRTLEAAGITEPKVGMELSGSISFFDKSMGTKEYDFILSGYYTEYIATLQYGPPDAFFSQAFVDSIFGDKELDATLYIRQDDRIEGRVAENRLYADIEMRDASQQFLGEITASGQAMYVLAGGFGTILILALVILVSVGLLIYNVLHISFEQNIRQYGLLKTLGTTRKQLRGIVFWQMRRTVLCGSLAGAVVGALLALLVVPILLSRMYLYRFGSAAGMITFRPILLAVSILFGVIVTFFSSALAVRRTVKLTPIEAVNYMEKADSGNYRGRRAGKKGKQKFQLPQMAWRNIMRFKKRFFISAFCLSLGFIASLAIVMISKGTDTRNEIEYKHWDIGVSTTVSAFECEGVFGNLSEDTLFPDELLHKIASLPGIEESDIARGGFVEVRVDEKALDLRREDMWLDIYLYSYPSTVQILSDEYLAELKAFAQEQGLYLDVDAVMEGEGVILLHDHALSPAQIEMSKDTVGMTLGIYDIVSKQKTKDMRFCGYLDLQQEGLPEIFYTMKSDHDVYLLASEKGFRNIKAREQNFHILLNVQPGSRVALSREVEKLVEEHNQKFKPEDYEGYEEYEYWDPLMLDVSLKIDTLQEMRDFIVSNRLVLGALCAILLLMGIVNYMDVTITGLTVRKKEFAVMESIGLTRKQLRKMLILEGVFYSLIITVLTGVLGGGIFFLIGKAMQQRMEYFVVQYPVMEFAACVAALFLSCIAIVLVLYRKYGEESISLRLRIYAD